MASQSEEPQQGDEGVGPRFRRGKEELDQLKGIEKQQHRSRKARRKRQKKKKANKREKSYPRIDSIEKSKHRLKNRLGEIKELGDAKKQFDS